MLKMKLSDATNITVNVNINKMKRQKTESENGRGGEIEPKYKMALLYASPIAAEVGVNKSGVMELS